MNKEIIRNRYSVKYISLIDNPVHIGKMPDKFWSRFLKSAKQRDVSVNITPEEMFAILQRQNFQCYYTGLNLCLVDTLAKCIASVDRVDSSQDYYDKDNSVWVYPTINTMKHCISHDVFVKLCTLVANSNSLGQPIQYKELSSEQTVTTTKAAKLLGVTDQTIRNMCKREDLEYHITKGGHRRISINSINEYLGLT